MKSATFMQASRGRGIACCRGASSDPSRWDHSWKEVRLNIGDDTDDQQEQQAPFDGEPQKLRLVPDEADCRAGNRDGLRRDHLSGDAAGAVRRYREDIGNADLVRRDAL